MNTRTQKLGREVKKLEFKIIKTKTNIYHIVVSRKRSSGNSRLDKVGFFHFGITTKLRLLGINFEKMKYYIKKGTVFHNNVLKFII